jgi:AcrR family transcriptional regulator
MWRVAPFNKGVMAARKERTGERRIRADSLRNRERLLAAAKDAFAETGASASLEEIARGADVGIGTLYRHFPTRQAIIEAVYQREVEQLAAAADRLLTETTPIEALRWWLRLSVDYLATKKVVVAALNTEAGQASALPKPSGVTVKAAGAHLLRAAIAAKEIAADFGADDLMQALAGLGYGVGNPGWKERALRLVDIVVAGLRLQANNRRRVKRP